MSKYMKVLKKKRFYVFSMSLLIFLVIMILMLKNKVVNFDEHGYHLIYEYLNNNYMTSFFRIITHFGSGIFLIVVTFISYMIIRNRKIFYGIITNLSLSIFLNLLIKEILKRDRPIVNQIISEIGYSFPSGHAMVSMAFYGFIIYLVYVYFEHKKYKWPIIIFLGFNIMIIGISRIYLGVHYLSDVLAGYFFSLAYLIIFVYFFNLYMNKSKTKSQIHEEIVK